MTAPIVVGYDGSDSAKVALDWALRRAERVRTDVEVVFAADDSWDSQAYAASPAIRRHGEVVLAGAAFHADSTSPHVAVHPRVVAGRPVEVLTAVAEEVGAGLLVVGSAGKDLYHRVTAGSVSVKVAASASVPVAVIPEHSATGHRSGVVVGVDGSEAAAPVLARAAAEAAALETTLRVLSAWTLPPLATPEFTDDPALYDALEQNTRTAVDEVIAAWRSAPDGAQHAVPPIETSIVLDSPATALIAAGAEAELLVVGSHGRRGLSRFLLGSVSHDVLIHAPCPVLVLRVADAR
ncbi:universal stress protein [Herbiconiux sp. CPCC 203407]|uniref:Universal stress protein n=1 Tax=Herbiconiux oxytropis TaxID=2970915 RepID=A0AA41XH95_9MICO|nr:universal stress protein [Herbiconiux oxytropis]MCS5723514.1 universal stress protein [Herbiconiux oxytropis]MCS5726433.1 universal stress protein [Herbiconiux oxytropis]